MRRFLYAIVIFVAILMFSCDTSTSPFDDSLPDNYTLTTNINPETGGTVTPPDGEFVDGTRIELLAEPSEGFLFDEWQGDLTGIQNPAVLFISRDLNITALFSEIEYQLNINVVGEGSVTQEIIDQEAIKTEGKESTQTSTPTDVKREVEIQKNDTGLRDKTSDEFRRLDQRDPDSPQNQSQERVQVQHQMTANQVVATYRVTAEAAEGWVFDRWEGDLTGNENPVDILVDEDKDITAVFVQDDFEGFTLQTDIFGNGNVDIDPDKELYEENEEVILTAIPSAGWEFIRWEGDLTGNDNPATILMDADKIISSIFEEEGSPEITVQTQPSETVAGNEINPAPSVELLDGNGEPLSGVNVSVSLNKSSFAPASTTQSSTNQNGIAAFDELVIQNADSGYRLTFSADIDGVSNLQSSLFDIIAAAGDPGNTIATVPNGVAGELSVIEIIVSDQFGNRVEGASSALSLEVVSGDNQGASFETISDEGNGIYLTGYTPTSSGSDEIVILLTGAAISGSPFTSSVITSSVSSSNSNAAVDPAELQVGNSSVLTIALRDNLDNPVTGISNDIQISGLGSASAGSISEDGETGVYTTNISSTTAETITLTIVAESVTLAQNPEINFISGNANEIEIQSGNNQLGTVTQPLDNPFEILVTDQFGNPVGGQSVSFEITQTPPASIGQGLSETTVTTNSSGEASSLLTLGTTPGTYEVTASGGSAGEVIFIANAELGAVSNLTILQQPSATVAGNVISPAPQIEVTDAGGNAIEGVEITVSEQGGYLFDSGTQTVTSNSSGVAEFDDIIFETSGDYTLVFSSDASGVDDVVSASFTVDAAAGDVANSTAVVSDGAAGEPTEISITIVDAFGNPVSGAAGTLSVEVSGANSASPTVNELSTLGEYTASYTPETAGTDNISIELNGTPIAGSPFESEVIVSDISGTVSAVAADPTELVVGNSSSVTVQVRDGSNNVISGLQESDFSINSGTNVTIGSVSETSTPGSYRFTITTNNAGVVDVTVTVQGVVLEDTPAITFLAGSPSQITITSQPTQTEAGQPVAGSPSILLRDSFNNPVPGVDVSISEQGGQEFAGGDLTVATNSSGIALFENAVITTVGRFNIVFTAGALVATSNAFDVLPSAADPETTTANVPNGAAGDATSITITVRDSFGNRVSGEADNLSINVSGANGGASVSSITDDGNGVYSASYTPVNTGADQINITLNGNAIGGSPFTSNVITSDADAIVVTVEPLQTLAGQAIAGPPTILVTDNLDNAVEGVEVTVSVQGGELDAGTTAQFTDESGLAEFDDLIINNAGNYSLEFNAIGVAVNAVSASFDILNAPPASISLLSGNNQTGEVTETLGEPLIVRITDIFGNAVENVTVDFSITSTPAGASGDALSEVSVQTNISGEASTELTLGTVAGIYSVTAAAGGVGSFTFNATAEPGAAAEFDFDPISSPQTAGETFGVIIRALDSEGNIASGYQGSANLSTTAGSITPPSATFSNGVASLNVEVNQAGSAQTISAADGSVTGTSNSFDVETGGIDPINSAVSANPENLEAGNTSTVTVELRDNSNNPISGLTDADFTIGLTGSATAGTVTEVTAGTYAVNIVNEVAETITVTVAVNGTTLTDSPFITFTPAAASQITIESGNNQTGEISTQLTDPFIVRVSDTFSNPVPDFTVTFSINQTPADAAGQSLSSSTVQTGTNGEAVVFFTLGDKAGTYTVNADGGTAGSVTFSAAAEIGTASELVITQQPGNTAAGEFITPAPEIQVNDAGGNPVGGIGVSVSLQDGSLFSSGTISGTTSAAGSILFDDLIIQTAGTYSLLFDTDASGVVDEISSEFTISAGAAVALNSSAVVPDGTAGNPTNISITVLDQFDNPVSGLADNLSIAISGANSGTPAAAESGTPGVYTASYTPTTAGTDNVTITLSGSAISGSPFTSQVTTSDISASSSTVTASPATLQVGSISIITIELRDGSNNPISGLANSSFTINESGDAVSGTVSETSTGNYQFTVQNETAETVTVSVTADGVTLNDIPEIVFNAGDVDIVAIQTQPGESIAGELITGPPLVRLLDEFNNRVPGVDINVSEQSGQTFASGTLILTSNSSGEAAFSDLVINEAGNYNLVFTASGQVGSTVAFDVIPAVPAASGTTANVPNGAAGDRTAITITVEDEFGNRVAGVAGALAVSVGGANDGAEVDLITDNGNGIYTAGYTPTTTGNDNIAITLNSTNIVGSPFTSEVVTSDADNVTVNTQPQQTIAGQPVAGPPAALVTDNLANTVSAVEVIAGLQSGNFDNGTTSVNSDNNGIATFSDLVINTAGTYIMEFNAVGVTDNAVSQAFDVIPAAASVTVSVSGDNQTGTVATNLAESFVVRVEDNFGNPVSGQTVDFTIDQVPTGATGQSLSEASVTTDATGEASTLLTLGTVSGTYSVNADAGAAGFVLFTANAEAGTADSFDFNTISSPQTAGQAFSITITAQDAFDNQATGYTGSAALNTSAGSVNPALANFTGGQATLDISVSEAGTGQTITANDGSITGTSNNFDVQSGGVNADNSVVSAAPTSLQAGNNSTVTIELRDGSNNPIGGLTDANFTLGLTGSATAGTVTEGTSGTYAVDIENETAETIMVTVTANGVTLTNSPSITYTAADATDLAILTGNNQTGTVGEALANPFLVQIADQFGNPVEGETVDFVIDQTPTGAVGQSLSQTSMLTDASGEASSNLTLGDTPGTYTTNVSSGSLPAVTFTAEAHIGEASQMVVTTQPLETTAGEAISPAPAVTVTDDVGNGVQGVSVTISELSGEDFSTGTLTQQTDAFGVASFPDLIFNTAQNYTLVFNASATGVSNVSSNAFDVIAATGDPTNTSADVPNGAAGEPTDITISVQDEFNNRVTGAADDLSASITAGPNSGDAFTSITDNLDGTYSTSYTPETIGTDEISITLNTIAISGSPYSSNVTTSDVSASNSTVLASPTSLQAGSNSEVIVELRDGSNNPISGLSSSDFNINVSGNGSADTILESTTNGTYAFNVTNTTAEDVTVSVTATGTTLNDIPQITFIAADPDLMLITTEPGNSVAGQPIEGPPAVRITDEYTNPVPSVSVDVTEQGGEVFATGSTTVITTNSLGFAIFDNIAIESVGQYNLVFSATGVTSRTSNAFNINPASISASASSATTTSPHTADGADASTVTVTLTDGFGNEINGLTDGDFIVDVGANATAGSVSETTTGGTYEFTVTNATVETVTVVITADGVTLDDQPVIEFQAGAASDMTITQQPTSATAGTAISPAPAVEVTDGTNPVSGVNVTAILSSNDFTATSTVVATTDAGGIAEFGSLVIETAGTGYSITFDADAAGVANVDSGLFDVTAAAGDPASTTATVPDGTAGQATVITINVTDEFGNPGSGVTSDLAVSVTGDNTTNPAVSETGTAGEYTASYTPVNSGTDNVAITLGGIGISGSDYTSEVSAGTATSYSVDTITTPQSAGTSFEITITALDVNLNTAAGYGGTANLTTTAGSITPGTAEFTNGVATLNVSVTDAGTGQTITADDGTISATSNTFDVEAGGVSALVSGVSATSPHTADGTDASTVTVTLADANGNEISGLADGDFTVNVGVNATAGAVSETPTAGTYEFTVTNTTVETVTAVITADGVTLDDQPAIEFQAGAASDMTITQQPTSATAGTAVSPAPAVEVTDGANPVSGVDVSVTLTGASLTAGSTTLVTTDASGIAEFTNLVIETAGTGYTITFDADAAGVANVDSDLFNVTEASASVLNISSGNNQTAQINESLTQGLAVEVTDAFTNPVQGTSVNFEITTVPSGSLGQSLSSLSAVTDASGVASTSLTIGDKVGDYLVNASSVGLTSVQFTATATTGDPVSMSVSADAALSTAGTTITGPPAVTVLDSGGNPVSGVNVTVTETGGYTFDAGTLTVATNASGIATFSDLIIEAANDYTLSFSADVTGITDVISGPFTVEAAAASTIEITNIATPQTAGTPFSVTLTALDEFGNIDLAFTELLDLSTTAGTIDPVSATMSNGAVTLDVTVTDVGNSQTITAVSETSGISGTSNTFDVEAGG